MVYRTVSSKALIARIFRDLKPGSADWVVDAVEWLGEVVERIGAYAVLEEKRLKVTAVNHKVAYPMEMESLSWVEYNGSRLPYAGGVTHLCTDRIDVQLPGSALVYQYQGNYYLTNTSSLTCSDADMEVTLHYQAFPLDEDGYPLIPDNFFYKTACFWYLAARLAMREQIKLPYAQCEERFNTYATLAENDCAFPSPDRMHTFRERWCRIVPNVRANFLTNPDESLGRIDGLALSEVVY